MLQKLNLSFALLAAVFILFSCKNDTKQVADQKPKVDTIQVQAVPKEGAATFLVTEGTVHWIGKKTVGAPHLGTINVEKGELLVNRNTLVSGTVTLDMNSIAVSDVTDAGERRDLESHLRDADFFEVSKFPKAEFNIKEVLPSNNAAFNWLVVGDLTMKGKSNSVNIPVKLSIEGDKLRAETPSFPINRTQWGINFRSGMLGTVKDKMIDDNIILTLNLQAKRG